MQEGPLTVSRFTQPIKSLAQRFAYLGLVLTAVGLMILGKVDVILMDEFRAAVTDAFAPILDAASRPIESIATAVDHVRELADLRQAKLKLRENEARLLQWQAAARRLEAENKILKNLLNFVPGPEPSFVTARVIADTGGAFAHSLILNAGSKAGVKKGQAAITGEGLIGRVAGVGARSARILLITDLNSRIPVLVGASRTRAILAGNNTDQPRLIHLPSGETVSPGDRIVTSGHGGAFPFGMPVGVVDSVVEGGIGVQPFVQRNRLEYIRILDYRLRGILQVSPPGKGPGVKRNAGDHKGGGRTRKP